MENKLQNLQQVVDSRNRIKNKLIQLNLVDNTAKLSDCADALETIDSLGGGGGDTLKGVLDAGKSMQYLFARYSGTSIDGLIPYDSTENVTNMNYLFQNCPNLLSIPSFNTDNATKMGYFASDCSALKQVAVFNIPKVTNVENMFNSCRVLEEVSLLNMGNVTSASNMFSQCYKLRKVKLSGVSNKLTKSSSWFYGCKLLELIDFRGATSVPSLTNTAVFTNVPSTCKVVVPDALFSSWKNGTNWSSISVTWVKESEYVEG